VILCMWAAGESRAAIAFVWARHGLDGAKGRSARFRSRVRFPARPSSKQHECWAWSDDPAWERKAEAATSRYAASRGERWEQRYVS